MVLIITTIAVEYDKVALEASVRLDPICDFWSMGEINSSAFLFRQLTAEKSYCKEDVPEDTIFSESRNETIKTSFSWIISRHQ